MAEDDGNNEAQTAHYTIRNVTRVQMMPKFYSKHQECCQ